MLPTVLRGLLLGSEGGGGGTAVAEEERGDCYGSPGVAEWRRWGPALP